MSSEVFSIRHAKVEFEKSAKVYDSALLKFHGADGYDVYNCSIPFTYQGKTLMYGRVERREDWAISHVRLFEKTGTDEYTAIPELSLCLEDPYIANIGGELIVGGTHVRKMAGAVVSFYGFFYRGTPYKLSYYTSGPDFMKDIRVVSLADGRVGVFSRRRNEDDAHIGFTIINDITELGVATIAKAPPLNLLEEKTWGGVNHPYLLSSGKVGCIGHYSYNDQTAAGGKLQVYTNFSFVLDPSTREITDTKVIGTRKCYPDYPAKYAYLEDCTFTSGIVMRDDGKCDLYGGLGDTHQGRITIDYPFEGHGKIVSTYDF